MKLFFYRGSVPNFGDELNEWMWPKLLPDFFDEDESELFLGIGSILFDYFPAKARKIVFGAGWGGYTAIPKIDSQWKLHFVRGKLTAQALGIDPSYGVGDAAILLRSCALPKCDKRYDVAFMPHWESTLYGNWRAVCQRAGIHYIDPCDTVDNVLREILSTRLILTEAMHGAIVSDALRVPWVALQPTVSTHRMKWFDWASALDIDLAPHSIPPSNALEYAMRCVKDNRRWIGRLQRRGAPLKPIASGLFEDRAAAALMRLSKAAPNMSSDAAIERSHARMLEHLQSLKLRAEVA